MRAVSLFSGVGGMDLGLERAGITVVAQCEQDPWRRAVLAARFPGVPCAADVREAPACWGGRSLPGVLGPELDGADGGRGGARAANGDAGGIQLVAGGPPCQDFSVAGRRAGLAGLRGTLFYEFLRVADELLPPGGWVLIENVPGLLSSGGGRDFAAILGALADIGFRDLAYRILDSRFFGVPQRRRRVFILARRARGERAAEVLLELSSGGGDPAPRPEARAEAAGGASYSARDAGWDVVSRKWAKDTGGPAGDECQNLVAVCATCANCAHGYHPGCVGCFDDGSPCGCPCGPETPAADWDAVSATLKGQRGKGGGGIRPEEQLVSPALVSRSSRGHAQPMSAGHHVDGVIEAAFMAEQQIVNALTRDMAGAGGGADDNTAQGGHLIPVDFHMTQDPIHSNGGTPALGRKSGGMGVMASGVRRLTPIEVERLQGLPDGWSAPPGLDAPDSRRYAAVGDAVTANVSQWIGERLLRFG